jgi:aerobic carbon-monoxide dehydrogenase medium subunit
VIPATADYVRAASLEEALEAIAADDAKVLAGGQSLLPAMKLRIARPALLVDIGGLGLDELAEKDGALAIGALATWESLERSSLLERPALAAIAECAAGIGDLQVRNRGTIGGSLAHADPASDMPAVMLALDATLRLRSRDGERTLAAAEFFLGPFTTGLSERELIVDVMVPVPPPGSGSAYVAVEHPASGFALAGAAALVLPDGSRRIAVTGVSAAPFLLDGDVDEALGRAEMFGDRFAPEDYRRDLARTVVRRAVERAEGRAKEDR